MNAEQLNTDEVMQLLASLENAEGKDRRRHPRTAVPHHVTAVLRRAGSAPVHAALRDLSRSGVGLFSPVPLNVDEQLDVTINRPGKPLQAACRVAGCRLNADGRYAVGLEFVQIARVGAAAQAAPQQATSAQAAQGGAAESAEASGPAAPVQEVETDPDEHIDAVAARLSAALAAVE